MNPSLLYKPEVEIKRPMPEPLRLNLGGAGEGYLSGKIPGFYIVDLRDTPDTDAISDISDLSWIQDEMVEEIYCSNALEHFPLTDTVRVLKEWHRVLKPSRKLWISVPDFDAAVRLYQTEGLCDWVKYLIWGDQQGPLNFHYINFTFPTLAAACVQAGFSDVRRVGSFPFGVRDASEHRDNKYKLPISLNVEVIR
jgi:hypothetical protein